MRLAIVAAIAALALSACGKGGPRVSYEQRIRNLEIALTSCDKEPEGDGYRRCVKRTEPTIRAYIDGLCPHAGGYTFQGVHEPCPEGP